MPEYKYVRLKKWFSYVGSGMPGDFVTAVYRGADINNRPDPLLGPNGGVPGKTYIVGLLSKASAVVAPCPDFCNGGEAVRLSKSDENTIAAFNTCLNELQRLSNRNAMQNQGKPGTKKVSPPKKSIPQKGRGKKKN